jgi:hypothetical protein
VRLPPCPWNCNTGVMYEAQHGAPQERRCSSACSSASCTRQAHLQTPPKAPLITELCRAVPSGRSQYSDVVTDTLCSLLPCCATADPPPSPLPPRLCAQATDAHHEVKEQLEAARANVDRLVFQGACHPLSQLGRELGPQRVLLEDLLAFVSGILKAADAPLVALVQQKAQLHDECLAAVTTTLPQRAELLAREALEDTTFIRCKVRPCRPAGRRCGSTGVHARHICGTGASLCKLAACPPVRMRHTHLASADCLVCGMHEMAADETRSHAEACARVQ